MVVQTCEFIVRQNCTFYHLFNLPPKPDISDFIESLPSSQISVDGAEAVFGKLFDNIGYGAIGELFRPLALSQLVTPRSKQKTVVWLSGHIVGVR